MKQTKKTRFETVPLKEVLMKVAEVELPEGTKDEPYSVPYNADADHVPAPNLRKRSGLL